MRPLSPELLALHKAKNLLCSFDRWCQGTPYRVRYQDPPQMCLGHAIKIAADSLWLEGKIIERIYRIIGTQSIPTWNDNMDRRYADVMDVLEKAILAAEQEWAKAA